MTNQSRHFQEIHGIAALIHLEDVAYQAVHISDGARCLGGTEQSKLVSRQFGEFGFVVVVDARNTVPSGRNARGALHRPRR